MVHEGHIFSGDWSPEVEDCKCHGLHHCLPVTDQYLNWFTRIKVAKDFEQDIRERGIRHGLVIEPDYYDRNTPVLCNGHHRLMVAYKYNLYVPLRLCMDRRDVRNRFAADNDNTLLNSGDPDRYLRRSNVEISSFHFDNINV